MVLPDFRFVFTIKAFTNKYIDILFLEEGGGSLVNSSDVEPFKPT